MPLKPKPAHLTGRALGCQKPAAGDYCWCKRGTCPAQVRVTKIALACAARHARKDDFAPGPLTARAVRSLVHDVAGHIGAGVCLATFDATRQGAREAGFRVDSRGRICMLRWDDLFHKKIPYWESATGT